MIISVHLPKTAGTSFLYSLDQYFGKKLLRDYDYPMHIPAFERNKAALQSSIRNCEGKFLNIECIHGHFLPVKYLLLVGNRETAFVAWMRDPVERILSHYHYWKRSYRPKKSKPIHREMIAYNWTLERFCFEERLKNLYHQYLWGFPIRYFNFIGITEFYNDDFEYFASNYLKTKLKPKRLNISDRHNNISKSFRSKVEQFHSRDMDLYETALDMREGRKK